MLGNFSENSFYVFQPHENSSKFSAKNRVLFTVAHGDPRFQEIDQQIVKVSESLNEGFLVGELTSSRHEILHILIIMLLEISLVLIQNIIY